MDQESEAPEATAPAEETTPTSFRLPLTVTAAERDAVVSLAKLRKVQFAELLRSATLPELVTEYEQIRAMFR